MLGTVDLPFQLKISRAYALTPQYILLVNNVINSLKKRASVSVDRAAVAALNLLKSVSFMLIIFGSVVCALCLVAGMRKLFFLQVSQKFLIHVKRHE